LLRKRDKECTSREDGHEIKVSAPAKTEHMEDEFGV
jgi:hypothetical protein